MRKISFADISIFIVNRIFNWRFWIASLTKKSKIAKKIIEKILFEDDDTIIIPNTISINQKIEGEKSEFLPTDILKEVIKKCDDIVIMNDCLCRTSSNCKDYPQDIGCIFLGPTSKKIPRNICHEATVEEALEHVDKADKAGLSHLIGRNKIDSIWMNVRPREGLLTICHCCPCCCLLWMNVRPREGLLTICHCCPCCCLWKVLPNLDSEISDKVSKLEGVKVTVDTDSCNLCRKCLKEVCMSDAISLKDNKIAIDEDKCRGCGLCAKDCPAGTMQPSPFRKSRV